MPPKLGGNSVRMSRSRETLLRRRPGVPAAGSSQASFPHLQDIKQCNKKIHHDYCTSMLVLLLSVFLGFHPNPTRVSAGNFGVNSPGLERNSIVTVCFIVGLLRLPVAYNRGNMKATNPLKINSIDVDSDEELDALMAQVLAEGDRVYQTRREEAFRLGIIDEKGSLLKRELPEDMREDAGTDFGG
jgi:hypothetical protein